MDTYTISNKKYYLSDEMMEEYPSFFKGCKNARSIIKKEDKLPENKYLFARLKEDRWKKSTGNSKKFDKVFISKKWFDSEYEDFEEEIIEIAPKEIILEEHEMFTDNDGNLIDIEVRGVREFDKCYFKVADIIEGFGLKKLHSNILDKKSAFEKDVHYKYFYIDNKYENRSKKLFLTLLGFKKILSGRSFDKKTIKSIYRWFYLFDNTDKQYEYEISKNNMKMPIFGVTYCITSPVLDAVKIGFWRSSIASLKSRYTTPYGKDFEIYTFKTIYPNKLEKKCHTYFKNYKITNELFDKENLDKYIEFMEENRIWDKSLEKQYDESVNYYEYNRKNNNQEDKDIECQDDVECQDDDVYENLPKPIYLDDREQICDEHGNVVEIDMVGDKESMQVYFKAKDVTKYFETVINHVIYNMKYDIDYKYFRDGKLKKLYLTYNGLLRVLFASHKKTADKFIKWATETLFIVQMGPADQKTSLASNLLGVSTDAVKAVFNKSSQKIPSIYLFSLGKVKKLRKSLLIDDKYDDDDFVYRFGMTSDLERRTKEHEKTLGKIKHANLELVLYGFVDPQYISQAETKIKHLFDGMDLLLDHKIYDELCIIPKNKMKHVREQYETISKIYMGQITELIQKLKDKDHEISMLQKNHEIELLKKDSELFKKEHENELLKKDLEITQLKLAKSGKK